jgi:L-ascorbate metabolism protein UlaG (beta-lactamase superfamily)
MKITLSWYGVSTFKLEIDQYTIFLDTYMDRVPEADDVGLKSKDVKKADYILIGHSHFDHMWGADIIGKNTGAEIIGSYETIRIMSEEGVDEKQLIPVAGGESIQISKDIRIKVLPSQHSCIWAKSGSSDDICLGDLNLDIRQRMKNVDEFLNKMSGSDENPLSNIQKHRRETEQGVRGEGGALAYVIDTPKGRILWKDSPGHWRGIINDIKPDLAILPSAGRGNIDGEPIQGSLVDFIDKEIELIKPKEIIFSHHDDWMPPSTKVVNMTPIIESVNTKYPKIKIITMEYNKEIELLN